MNAPVAAPGMNKQWVERRAKAVSRGISAGAPVIAAKAEIDTMLERLMTLSDDHFETHPHEIHWGHVGTLKHYAGLLRQISDSAFKEGEHAA